LAAHFEAMARATLHKVRSVNKALAPVVLALAPLCASQAAAAPSGALDDALAVQVQALAREASREAAPGLRVEVRVGRLDPRLKLAPCAAVLPYLPQGTRLWGAARIGLRCNDGIARWHVFLPIQVDVWGPGVVAAGPLAAGATVGAGDLKPAEVNLAAQPGAAVPRPELAVGRVLARPLAAGAPLFAADLRAPTPTAAAELATQITIHDLAALTSNLQSRLISSTLNLLSEQKTLLSSLAAQLRYSSPERRIHSERQRVDELARRAHSSLTHRLQLQSTHVKGMQKRLAALSPHAVLGRGYAVVTRKEDGRVVSRVAQASDVMNVRVSDGEFEVKKR